MRLIKPSFEIIEQKPRDIIIPADMKIGPKMIQKELLNSIYRQIEIAGRTCYKSEDKITNDSAEEFVDRMIKSGHGAMLEHGTVYLHLNMSSRQQYFKYCSNPYSTANSTGEANNGTWQGFVTTNYRVIVENNWLDDLKYICKPTEYHEKRVTVRFVCDRGITAEYNRHRVNSIAEMSTRYVAFDKDKFGGELSVIQPCWISDEAIELVAANSNYENDLKYYCDSISNNNDVDSFSVIDYWLFANLACEYAYLNLRRLGWKAQQARTILPLDLQTELVHTATVSQWKHFFELRDASNAHPQARELAHPLHLEFIKRGLL